MTGRIVHIDKNRKFGFLISKDSKNIYFKLRNCQYEVKVNDFVAFKTIDTSKGTEAVALRKIYINKNGIVFIPRLNRHHIHVVRNELIEELINNVEFYTESDIVEIEYEFPMPVGYTKCVPTSGNDKIVYAIRKGRKGHTRFVLNRSPKACRSIFAVLKKIDEGYLIITIYVGKKAAREPWDKRATREDLEFWNDHALIFDEQKIIPHTYSLTKPWILNEEALCKLATYDRVLTAV